MLGSTPAAHEIHEMALILLGVDDLPGEKMRYNQRRQQQQDMYLFLEEMKQVATLLDGNIGCDALVFVKDSRTKRLVYSHILSLSG